MMGRGDHDFNREDMSTWNKEDFMNNIKPQKKKNTGLLGKITDTVKNLFSFHLPSLGGLEGLFHLPSFHLGGNT